MDQASIDEVMQDCNCSRDRAMQLLQLNKNDPQSAKNHHRMLSGYMGKARSTVVRSRAPSRSSMKSAASESQNRPSLPADRSSAAEGIITPATEEDSSSNSGRILSLAPRLVLPITAESQIRRDNLRQFESWSLAVSDEVLDTDEHTEPFQPIQEDLNIYKAPPRRVPPSPPLIEPLITPTESLHDDGPVENADSPEETQKRQWNFELPEISVHSILLPGSGSDSEDLDLENLVGAMQQGANAEMVQRYLAYFPLETVRRKINSTVEGFPSIFYAVATNDEAIIRTWIAHGGDVTAVHQPSGVPLIGFAILNSEKMEYDTTQAVATLLSLGATAQVIPTAFYSPFNRDIPETGPELESIKDSNDKNKRWCTEAARKKLARTMNITHRYYLDRAAKMKKPSLRQRQVAKYRNAEALLGIPYYLIGQTAAANLLLQKLLSHIMLPNKKPLVLVFAGPSGHGKTELARRLGHLLSLDLEVVDCTVVRREIELFGPREPYAGSENGSPINNFLAQHDGKRSIVFLDEFEKTTSEIHQALLLPFDSGDYEDRRHRSRVDCSQTIWILATNALDPTIKTFCTQNHDAIFVSDDQIKIFQLMKDLSRNLKSDFINMFGSPITGRVSAFLPFLHFSPGEQAVIVHKYLLELGQKVRAPINFSPGDKEQLLGNVRLKVRRDSSVCNTVAREEYNPDLGARSLITAVKSIVEDALVDSYLAIEKQITEADEVVNFVVDVNRGEIVVNMVN